MVVAFHGVSEPPSRLRRVVRAVAVDAGLLRRRRDYRLLVAGQFVSLAGSQLTFVAVPFQTFQITRSSLAVGLLGVAEFVPILVLALVGGALADAFDRRRLVALAEGGATVVALVLVVNALLPDPHLWVLYVSAALMAAFTALRRPPLDALVPQLVERDELKASAAIDFLAGNVAMVAGPALAGALIALAGLEVTYAIDAATFVASLLALRAMRTPPPPPDAPAPSWRSVVEGVRYAGSRQELLGTYLVDMNAMFFGMPLALFPALAERYGGAGVLGLMYAAPAAGAVVAALASGWTRHVHRHGRAVALAAAGWGSRSSDSGSRTRCGSRSCASRSRGRWTRSAACSAARSGTRRSRRTCAAGWRGSRCSRGRRARRSAAPRRAPSPRSRACARPSSRAASCASPGRPSSSCCCRASGATTPACPSRAGRRPRTAPRPRRRDPDAPGVRTVFDGPERPQEQEGA